MKKSFKFTAIIALLALSLSLFITGCASADVDEDGYVSSDAIVKDLKNEPDKYDGETVVFAALGKLEDFSTYESYSSGSSSAKKGFINYEQITSGHAIKHGDEFYVSSVSDSAFVHLNHEAFYKADKIAYREDGGSIKNTEKADYKNVYGVTPDKLLTGHVFNRETIKSATLLSSENGEYTYEVILYGDKANCLMKKQMKMFGKLSAYPSFSSDVTLNLVVKADFTPVSAEYSLGYDVEVPVLGSVSCEEQNKVVFSSFEEAVTIPDTDAFNAAINEQPSKVTPGEMIKGDENVEKLFNALLESDFENGVSLVGTLTSGDNSLAVKAQTKIDVKKLVKGDFRSAVDLKVSVGALENASLTAILHGDSVYAKIFDKKYRFLLPEVENEIPEDFDISDYISVIPADEKNFIVTLSDELNQKAFEFFKELGLVDKKSDFGLSFAAYMPNGRIGSVSGTLRTKQFIVKAKFNVSDEKFSLDENLAEYTTDIKLGLNADIKIGDFGASVNADVYYDGANTNPDEALKVEVKITLDEQIKYLLNLAGVFSSDIPAELAPIAEADELYILYDEKELSFIAEANGLASLYLPMGMPSLGGTALPDTGGIGGDFIISLISSLFKAEFYNGVLKVSFADSVIDVVNGLWADVTEKIIDVAGTQGVFVSAILGIYKPINEIALYVDIENKELSLVLNVYDIDADVVFVPGADYDTLDLLSITVTPSDTSSWTYSHDVKSVKTAEEKAAKIRQTVEYLKTVRLDENYLKELDELSALYENSTEEVQALAYNYMITVFFSSTPAPEYLKSAYDDALEAVTDFVAACGDENTKITSLNYKYGEFTEEQKKYLVANYESVYNAYIAKRKNYEATSLVQVKEAIDALVDVDYSMLSPEDLLNEFKAAETLYKNATALFEGSLSEDYTEKLENYVEKVVAAYVKTIGEKAVGYLSVIKGMRDDSFTATVDYMNEFYTEASEFYESYYDAFSSSVLVPFINAENFAFFADGYKVTYYLDQNSTAFRKGAAKVASDAIEALLSASLSDEEIKAEVEKIDALIEKTDENAVARYDEYLKLKENLQ